MKKLFCIFCFVLTISNVFSQTSWASFVLSNTACINSTKTVTAITGTNVAIGYTWTALPSNSIIASPNNSITLLNFIDPGTYTVMLSADDGSTIATDSKTITAGPNITTIPGGTTGPYCPPPSVAGSLLLPASGAVTYTWMPGSFVGNPYFINPLPLTTITYTVFGTDVYGCTGNNTLTVVMAPKPVISVSASFSLACDGQPNICFTGTAPNSIPTSWWWQDGCLNSFNGSNSACFSASLLCGNIFTVSAWDSGPQVCTERITFSITISPCTGLVGLSVENNEFEIFPNPIVNTLNLKSLTIEKENTQMEISDITGRIISKSKCNFNSEGVYTINVSEFSSGIYFARIISENQISQQIKIIKE